MKYKIFLISLLFTLYSLLFTFVFAQAQPPGYNLPPLPTAGPFGTGLTAIKIMDFILIPLTNFLIAAGIILAIITIVVAGVMYLKAGGNPDSVKKAQAWFKNGLIGAFIILGVGVIIWTVYGIVTGQFFNIFIIPGPIPGP